MLFEAIEVWTCGIKGLRVRRGVSGDMYACAFCETGENEFHAVQRSNAGQWFMMDTNHAKRPTPASQILLANTKAPASCHNQVWQVSRSSLIACERRLLLAYRLVTCR